MLMDHYRRRLESERLPRPVVEPSRDPVQVRLLKPVAWRKEIARSARLLAEGHER